MARVQRPSELLTFDAGHHTVYQHANFEFGLENISRQFVWTFLHSYPFYNSEQSSQRYVKLKEPRAFVPPLTGEAQSVYESAIVRAWDRYGELSALLKDDALAILNELRYVRPTTSPERLKQIDRDADPPVAGVLDEPVDERAAMALARARRLLPSQVGLGPRPLPHPPRRVPGSPDHGPRLHRQIIADTCLRLGLRHRRLHVKPRTESVE